MTDLTTLISKRARLKSQLTRFTSNPDALSDNYSAAPETFEQVGSRLNKMKTIRDSFDADQYKIKIASVDDYLRARQRRGIFRN